MLHFQCSLSKSASVDTINKTDMAEFTLETLGNSNPEIYHFLV